MAVSVMCECTAPVAAIARCFEDCWLAYRAMICSYFCNDFGWPFLIEALVFHVYQFTLSGTRAMRKLSYGKRQVHSTYIVLQFDKF